MCRLNRIVESTITLVSFLLSLSCESLLEFEKTPAAELVPVVSIVTDASEPLVIIATDTLSANIYQWTYGITEEDMLRLSLGWTIDLVATYGVEQDSVWLRFRLLGDSGWVSLWDFTPEEGNYAYGFYATDVWDYLDGPDMPPARELVNGSSIVIEGRNLEGTPSLRAVRINPDVHSVPLPEHGVISYAGIPEEGMIRLADGYHWYRDGIVEEEVFTTGSFLQITPDHVWWIAGLGDTTQNMLVWYDRRSGVQNQTPLSHGGWNYFAVIQNELVGNPYLHNPAFPHDWAWVRYDLDDILAGRGLRSSFIDTVFMYTRYRTRGSIWSENAIIADIFLQSVRTPVVRQYSIRPCRTYVYGN